MNGRSMQHPDQGLPTADKRKLVHERTYDIRGYERDDGMLDVEGKIVALFGGFLLAGVLTQPGEESVPAVGASASASTQAEPTEVPAPSPTAGPSTCSTLQWATR